MAARGGRRGRRSDLEKIQVANFCHIAKWFAKWFATLPNGLPNGLPLRLKKYDSAPDFGAIYKDSNHIYRILVSK
ncbi:MAG: hypothetical protein RXO36_07395 [Candidatus Nanopusillus acidilobi]